MGRYYKAGSGYLITYIFDQKPALKIEKEKISKTKGREVFDKYPVLCPITW